MDYSNILNGLSQNFDVDLAKDVRYSEPLLFHSSFRVGGPADVFLSLKNAEAISWVYSEAKKNKIPVYILGNGSNILFSDKGFRGIVLSTLKMANIKVRENKITCGSGVSLNRLCNEAKKASLAGLEFAYGIPGSVGGALFMNAGAYGGEMKDVIISTEVLDLENGKTFLLEKDQHEFGYRSSAFQKHPWLILSTLLGLSEGKKEVIAQAYEENYQKRISKQPLEYPSAGSTFKRPEGYFAGKLIEDCHLKGYSIGGAMVSEKHAGFVINYQKATSQDITDLISHVQKVVYEEKGVRLETEVISVGEEG